MFRLSPHRPASTIAGPTRRRRCRDAIAFALLCLGIAFAGGAGATGAKPVKPPAKAARKPPPPPPDATPEQIEAARLVFYGRYACELGQAIDIASSARYQGYVDVRHGKAAYLMKPVLSPTGAVRLEDLKGETLVLQIASKSMLMNVKTGRRLVDECVSPQQRALKEAAAAPAGASEPTPAR
jgi:hypothetical protein